MFSISISYRVEGDNTQAHLSLDWWPGVPGLARGEAKPSLPDWGAPTKDGHRESAPLAIHPPGVLFDILSDRARNG